MTMPLQTAPAISRRNVRLLVLAGGLIMGLALGIRHVQGLFLVPITGTQGWTREMFAFAMALQNIVWGVAQPFAGMLADRHGAGKVIGGGIALYAAGLAMMACAASPLAFYLGAGLCLGLALSGTTFGVIYAALSRLIPLTERGWALGVAGAVGGLGQFLLVPAAQPTIQALNWNGALLALAVVMALILPLAALLREPHFSRPGAGIPALPEQPLADALRDAFSHPGFLLLSTGFFACGFQLAFIATHLPAYLLDHGLRPRHGVAALALIALTNVAGIYWCAVLGERVRRKYMLFGVYLARSAAIALFVALPPAPWTVYLFAAAMGLLWLGTVPLTNGLLLQVFGVRYLGTLFGFVFLGHQAGSFLGVWLGGVVFDATGSYAPVWWAAIAVGVVAALMHWPIDDRSVARMQPLAAGA